MKTNNRWMIPFPDKICPAFFSFNQVFGYETWNELKQTTFIDDKIFTKMSSGIQTVLLQSLWFVPVGIHTLITVFMAKFWFNLGFAKNGGWTIYAKHLSFCEVYHWANIIRLAQGEPFFGSCRLGNCAKLLTFYVTQ